MEHPSHSSACCKSHNEVTMYREVAPVQMRTEHSIAVTSAVNLVDRELR